ncbi:MAG: 4-hydroxy-3-methylbut-2-enyl diphosphate reductase [Candidatus Omnitrophica bacterium]|nr:4-hydroxy-3-methylbut-2-enyl diphosphate reductase [Candidatus Omnitrophota bacterium]MCM8793326.1 4-hydroxy-3-methylbut-2-enyl diphosphate reductase [Candidatus Omnitrophota bacterium]
MQIKLAQTAGFCFGVKRAIRIAEDLALKGKKICLLKNIVHNEDVSKKLYRLGVRKIKKLNRGKGKILLISAHGAGEKVFEQAKKSGYEIVDATCPMVKEIHKIAKEEERKKRQIIIIGDKNHDEVLGIAGQLKNKALIVDPGEKIHPERFKGIGKASAVVQSTQNDTEIEQMEKILKRYIKDLNFFNTICQPTRIKQRQIRTLSKECNLVLIIGSKTSANTKRLYEIAHKINKNTYWIRNKKDIKPEWFNKVSSVGITAGASTPDETIREAEEFIKKWS